MMPSRPVWAEISLQRLRSNYRHLLHSTAAASDPAAAPAVLAVVKADAYGHGVELCGPALAPAGAPWLGVTSADEGARLRRSLGVLPHGVSNTRILVMSGFWPGEAELLLDRALTPQVWEPYHLVYLLQAATRRSLGPSTVPIHLEIDTGMSRQGVAPGPALAHLLNTYFAPASPFVLEGVLTHFSAPERLDEPDTDTQLTRLAHALAQIRAAGLRPLWLHAGNSATAFDAHALAALATLASQYTCQLMLRPGLALYGYPTRFTPEQPDLSRTQAPLQPVLAWKTRITSLRDVPPGAGAGYNSIFRATRPTRLALTPVGYADGLNRLLSNPAPSPGSAMLVRGRRAPIAGRISMDQTILDVTAIPEAAIGDEVVILGDQDANAITAWEHADLCATIPYEILCNIASRVPRLVLE